MAKYKSDPKKGETEAGKKIVDDIIRQGTFEPFDKPPGEDRDFFTFNEKGDQVKGVLGPPIANLHRSTSYPIKQDDGTVIEVFGSRLLHRIIRKNELIGQKVRIVLIGRQHRPHCRWPRKIYRVYKIKWNETEEQVTEGAQNARRKI